MKLKFKNKRYIDKSSMSRSTAHRQLNLNKGFILYVLMLLAIFLWSYWPTVKGLYTAWSISEDHSIGLLIPFMAIFLIWYDRKVIKSCSIAPCWWTGIAIVLLAQTAHIYGLLYGARPSIERYSLVLTIAGLVLMIAGWQMFRRLSGILLFLFLIVPIPNLIITIVSVPLQYFATKGTVFCLEAFGVEAVREGNIVMLNRITPMGIAEACNGLRMLTAFIIVTAFLTYLMKCSRNRKMILLFSSIPIALICNIVRLCITAVAMLIISVEAGQKFFHDFAGLSMMPIAVLLLFVELRVMDKIYETRPRKTKKQVVGNSRSTCKTETVKPHGSKKARKIIISKG